MKKTFEPITLWEAIEALYTQIVPMLDNILTGKFRISLKEFYALRAIYSHWESHIRIQELSHSVGLSQSAMSRLVDRLEKQSPPLLKSFACTADKRGKYTELTTEGKSLFLTAQKDYEETLKVLMGSPESLISLKKIGEY